MTTPSLNTELYGDFGFAFNGYGPSSHGIFERCFDASEETYEADFAYTIEMLRLLDRLPLGASVEARDSRREVLQGMVNELIQREYKSPGVTISPELLRLKVIHDSKPLQMFYTKFLNATDRVPGHLRNMFEWNTDYYKGIFAGAFLTVHNPGVTSCYAERLFKDPPLFDELETEGDFIHRMSDEDTENLRSLLQNLRNTYYGRAEDSMYYHVLRQVVIYNLAYLHFKYLYAREELAC